MDFYFSINTPSYRCFHSAVEAKQTSLPHRLGKLYICGMTLGGEIVHLIRREILLEWRNRYALGGILLYVITTIYIAYQSFREVPDQSTWNALFWIILFFTAINAVSKSFMQEAKESELYLYSLATAQAVLLAKIIYNMALMWLLGAIAMFFFSLFIGIGALVHANFGLLTLTLLIGSSGFGAILTMISAIASKTSNNLGIMAILGFPIALPFLLAILQLSQAALAGESLAENLDFTLVAALINAIVIALSYILFPYLWRD